MGEYVKFPLHVVGVSGYGARPYPCPVYRQTQQRRGRCLLRDRLCIVVLGITRWGSRGRIQRNGSENANESRSHLQSGMGIILIR